MAWMEEGHFSAPYDSTQGRELQTSTVQQLPLYGTSSTAIHLTGRMGLAVHQTFLSGTVTPPKKSKIGTERLKL